MRRLLGLCIAVAIALTSCPRPADAQMTLVLIKYIDRVEHLNLLEKLWKGVTPAQEKVALSQPDWPELKTPISILGGVNIVHFSDTGFENQAAIEAPISYSICHATMKDPSITCSGSLTAVYRTATDPDSKKIDGLHYTIAYSKPNPTATQPLPGKCWVSGTIVITFVVPSKRSDLKCGQTGSVAFQFPNNEKKDNKTK